MWVTLSGEVDRPWFCKHKPVLVGLLIYLWIHAKKKKIL